MPNITVQIVGLKELEANFAKAPTTVYQGLDRGIKRSAVIITKSIKDETPVKTGTLKRGIRPTYGRLKAVISPHNAPYAIFVHEGTQPHIIEPVTKKALFWKGALHPVKRVKHPGTKANPFMTRGLDKSMDNVNKELKHEVDKIIAILAKQ